MKVYVIPYTVKTFFDHSKRVSGIDMAALTQFKIAKELGHDVRMFTAFGNLHEEYEGVDYYSSSMPTEMSLPEYSRKHKKEIVEKLFESIAKHKPDVIYSNFEFTTIYKRLMTLDIPIIFNSHAKPGFWSDFTFANQLEEFTKSGHTYLCVSEYHKAMSIKYYKLAREGWTFKSIYPDDILFPQYCDLETVKPASRIVRHISAASPEKKTFFIHEVLSKTDIPSEVFTTIKHLGGKENDYVTKSLEKYNSDMRINRMDVPHKEIMETISDSACMFVGLASFDAAPITAVEALSRGIPLIVKGYKGVHPAQEILSKHLADKYVYCYEKAEDFIAKVEEFSKLDELQRFQIAHSAFEHRSKEAYAKKLNEILHKAIEKHQENSSKRQGIFEFFE